jgi:hypothetical protein
LKIKTKIYYFAFKGEAGHFGHGRGGLGLLEGQGRVLEPAQVGRSENIQTCQTEDTTMKENIILKILLTV